MDASEFPSPNPDGVRGVVTARIAVIAAGSESGAVTAEYCLQ